MKINSKVNILFLSHSSSLAGAEISLLTLIKNLNRNKYEPLVILPCHGPLVDELNNLQVNTIIYPIKRWVAFRTEYSRWHFRKLILELPKRIQFLISLIKEERIDVIYTNTITCIDGAIAAKLKHIPHIWHISEIINKHNTSLKPYLPKVLIKVLVNMLSSKIIVVSEAVERGICIKVRKKDFKIKVVYQGFDNALFNNDNKVCEEKPLRVELGLDDNIRIVALLGTYLNIKGQEDLIIAAKFVISKYKNVVFVLFGNGNPQYIKKLQAMVAEAGLKDKIYLLGFRKDVISLYKSIDILVSASWVESFGRTIVEAMLIGKPVVATRVDGSKESIIDGETGILVQPRSSHDLANGIIKLLSDSKLANRIGIAGCERISKMCDVKTYICNTENIIKETKL